MSLFFCLGQEEDQNVPRKYLKLVLYMKPHNEFLMCISPCGVVNLQDPLNVCVCVRARIDKEGCPDTLVIMHPEVVYSYR